MSVTIPPKIDKFKALQEDFGTTVAVALWKKAAQAANFLNKAYPVGMILFFHSTQDALPSLPNSQYWVELDGSTISNANSLLNGVTLPDYRNKFFRHPTTGETVVTTGGSDTKNLSHNHGGATGVTDDRHWVQMDNGDERPEGGPHSHSISSDMGSTDVVPVYIALKCYIRIA